MSLRWYPRAWRFATGPTDRDARAVRRAGDHRGRLGSTSRFRFAGAAADPRARPTPPPGTSPRRCPSCPLCLDAVRGWWLRARETVRHRQAVIPPNKQSLPSHAFSVLYWTAGVGSVLVIAGVAISLPALFALLRRGGWIEIRRPYSEPRSSAFSRSGSHRPEWMGPFAVSGGTKRRRRSLQRSIRGVVLARGELPFCLGYRRGLGGTTSRAFTIGAAA